MRLDAWLRQDPSVVERLQLVERLAQAVNAAHDRGQLLGALEPSRISVAGNGDCDVDDALRGTPAAEYRAPEREGNTPSSPAADVYAAGAIVWEVLVGRPYTPAPSHLSEARSDLPADLADGVMACLERSPEWRPRDLAYVAQLAQQAAAQRGGTTRASRPTAKPAASPERSKKAGKAAARSAPESRGGGGDGRSPRLLLIAAGLLAAVAAGGYFWMTRGSGTESAAAPRPIVPATATPGAPGAPATEPTATPEPLGSVAAPTAAPAASGTPTPAPTPTPKTTPTPAAAPVAATLTRPPLQEPAAAAPASTAVATTSAPPPAVVTPPAAAAAPAAPAPAPPRERAELATLSPLSVKRPGRVLFDLHGTALAADLQARLVAVREAPRGLSVIRQKCAGTLCNVLVELDGSVKPAIYAIVLEDPEGHQTNALTFTVTR